jgi:hypothetical protein
MMQYPSSIAAGATQYTLEMPPTSSEARKKGWHVYAPSATTDAGTSWRAKWDERKLRRYYISMSDTAVKVWRLPDLLASTSDDGTASNISGVPSLAATFTEEARVHATAQLILEETLIVRFHALRDDLMVHQEEKRVRVRAAEAVDREALNIRGIAVSKRVHAMRGDVGAPALHQASDDVERAQRLCRSQIEAASYTQFLALITSERNVAQASSELQLTIDEEAGARVALSMTERTDWIDWRRSFNRSQRSAFDMNVLLSDEVDARRLLLHVNERTRMSQKLNLDVAVDELRRTSLARGTGPRAQLQRHLNALILAEEFARASVDKSSTVERVRFHSIEWRELAVIDAGRSDDTADAGGFTTTLIDQAWGSTYPKHLLRELVHIASVRSYALFADFSVGLARIYQAFIRVMHQPREERSALLFPRAFNDDMAGMTDLEDRFADLMSPTQRAQHADPAKAASAVRWSPRLIATLPEPDADSTAVSSGAQLWRDNEPCVPLSFPPPGATMMRPMQQPYYDVGATVTTSADRFVSPASVRFAAVEPFVPTFSLDDDIHERAVERYDRRASRRSMPLLTPAMPTLVMLPRETGTAENAPPAARRSAQRSPRSKPRDGSPSGSRTYEDARQKRKLQALSPASSGAAFVQWHHKRGHHVSLSDSRLTAVAQHGVVDGAADRQPPVRGLGLANSWVMGTTGASRGEYVWDIKVHFAEAHDVDVGQEQPNRVFMVGMASAHYKGRESRCPGYFYRCDGALSCRADGDSAASFGAPYRSGCVITVRLDLTRWEIVFDMDGHCFGVAFRFTPVDDPEPLYPVVVFAAEGDSAELRSGLK